jgi:hypothetical protein
MALADERILEYLAEFGPAEPAEIVRHDCVHFNRQYVGRRLRQQLEPRDLVSKAGRGTYFITDEGRAYLAGELDADTLEK